MTTEVKVPTLGESITEATLGQWLKKPGEAVKADEPIASLETDKVAVEVPAPTDGVIGTLVVKEGDTVEVGAVIATIEAGAAGAAAAPKPAAVPAAAAPVAAAPAVAASEVEVKVPTLGESITEATVGQWLKQPGDAVAADEPIASLETDKVAVEVNAPAAGVLGKQLVKEGDTVQVGAVIATVAAGAAAPAAKAAPAAAAPQAAAPGVASDALSPSAKRAAIETGVNPATVAGTGKDGRVTRLDIEAAAKAAPVPAVAAAAVPVAAGGRKEERVKMTRLRQTIAKRLKEAQNTAAMLTTFNDVDMTAVIETRAKYKDLFEKKHGVRLGFMGFFVKAACMALKDVPAVNASIEGDELVYHGYADVSVAVSAPNGLVVPVIRDAQDLSVAGIEKTIGDFGKRAKDGTLKMEEMKGGTFTISNGGVFGSLMSTPIINPPQAAVLGLHRIEERPVVRNGQIVVRQMMYMALSYDHRIIDGREAVTFLVALKNAIEDPTRLLIDL